MLHSSFKVPRAQNLKQQSPIGHFPTNFPHLAEQIQFATPYLLYISNGETIDNLLQCSCFQGMANQFHIVISSSACIALKCCGPELNICIYVPLISGAGISVDSAPGLQVL